MYKYADTICSGHNEDDVLEFSNFLNKGETYTNSEFFSFIHPLNEEMPYMYDTYDFDYCADQGYDFLDFSSKKNKNDNKKKKSTLRKTIPSGM